MGETMQLPNNDNANGNLLLAQDAQLAAPGTLESLSFFVTNAAGNLVLGVYDASGTGGGPGKLMASTNAFRPTTGWNTQSVITPVNLAPGKYWLAYLPSDNALAFLKETTTGTAFFYVLPFGTLPATFKLAGASQTVVHWSLYASLIQIGPTPIPTPTPPTPTPGPTPPPQAVAAGFTSLNFDQEPGQTWDIGYGTDGHKWNAGLWWYPVPPSSDFTVNNGIMTLTCTSTETDLCTQFHDATGGTYFQGGYFEAYMSTTDWSAFWLFCADRPWVFGNLVLPSNPLTWTNEIDVIETDPGAAFINNVTTTIHKNTSGNGGVPDAINLNNNNTISDGPVESTWHIYGVLWTQTRVTWYVDNVEVCTYPTFVSTWQPVQLILSAAPNGVNGSSSNVMPPITQIQWVRVWEPAGYVNPTPTP
jgi:hypothetical protein